MADLGQWLHALFSPTKAYGQTTRPASAPVDPTTTLVPGVSMVRGTGGLRKVYEPRPSLQTVPFAERKKEPARETIPATRKQQRVGNKANRLLSDLFGEQEALRGDEVWGGVIRPVRNDRMADRILNRSGYFDPSLSAVERHNRALKEWYDHLGINTPENPTNYTQSPFYRPARR